MSVFGPIPSRRLGRSLGINNLDARICTYACVYCQAGRTAALRVHRSRYASPELLAGEVARAVDDLRNRGETVDYLTFVPDGEPTLDARLGQEIRLLRPLGIPVAVITNGSLLWMSDVREDLMAADWVSVKVDMVEDEGWRRLNRPHGRLDLPGILEGVARFAKEYGGTLATETMMVRGVNDGEPLLRRTAAFLAGLSPARSYLSIPLRPPAEPWVAAPEGESQVMAYEVFRDAGLRVELLCGHEPDEFGTTGSVRQGILNTTAVHPMREEALIHLLKTTGGDHSIVSRLVSEGFLRPVLYNGVKYFIRGPARTGRSEGGAS